MNLDIIVLVISITIMIFMVLLKPALMGQVELTSAIC